MLRRIGILLLLIGLGVGAGLLFVTRRSGEPAGGALASSVAGTARLGARLARAAGGGPVRLDDSDLRTLLLIALERHPNGRQALGLAREARASVADGRLELGLLINLSAADDADLTAEQREILAGLLAAVPFLRDRDLYLAVSGVPEAAGGAFSLAREGRFKISFLNLSAQGLAELLDRDVAEVRQALVFELPVRVEGVRVEEDVVLVEVARR